MLDNFFELLHIFRNIDVYVFSWTMLRTGLLTNVYLGNRTYLIFEIITTHNFIVFLFAEFTGDL